MEAKARREALKQKFASQQASFSLANPIDDEILEEAGDGAEDVYEFPHGTCIVCQEAADKNSMGVVMQVKHTECSG